MSKMKQITLTTVAAVSLTMSGPAFAQLSSIAPKTSYQFMQTQPGGANQLGTQGSQSNPGGPRSASDQIGSECMPGTNLDDCWKALNEG